MNRGGSLLTGMGVGMGLAYLLDPASGGRRRARVRDGVVHAGARTQRAIGSTARDLSHRISGTAAAIGSAVRRDEPSDEVLAARVRAALGRVVSHPHAVEVAAHDGTVTLRGPILAAEVPALLRETHRVRGVQEVVDELEPMKQPGNIPALQGGAGRRREPRLDVLQRRWAPATRVVTGAAGSTLAAYGARRRDAAGWLLVAIGAALAARAAANVDLRRLSGFGAGHRAVDIQKTITVNAPIEEVFTFWTSYENFPHFMTGVLDVRASRRSGQSHWTVAGPAGAPVHFDAEIVAMEENEYFAWRTLPRSPVGHAGLIRFERAPEGGTRVNIRMSYNPPGGWLGHGVAKVFGVDPKSAMDADLMRAKTLLETGRPPHDAAQRDLELS